LRFCALSVAAGGAYGVYWHRNRASQVKRKFQEVDDTISAWKPFNIEGYNAW